MKYFIDRDQNNKITSAWSSQQYSGQEQVDDTHADYLEFAMLPKIAQIRAMRNRKLDEIDVKFCNAQKWSAMTQTEKDSWTAIKTALVGLTDKNLDGSYKKLTSLTVDGYLDPTQNVWPW